MELETPTTALCPMCEEQEVEILENAGGKPYFTCRAETCNTTVNLNGKRSIQMLSDYLIEGTDDDGVEVEQADPDPESETNESPDPDDGEGGSQTLEDVFG